MNASVETPCFEDVLRESGVSATTLTISEREQFDRDGHCLMPGIIDPAWLQLLRDRFDALVEKEGAGAGLEVHQEAGTRRVADLVNKGAMFDGVWMHPRFLAAAHHILKRDFKLLSVNGRDALVGAGHQGLHSDWGHARVPGSAYHLVNAIVALDELTADNGAPRIVPSSHQTPGHPRDHMADVNAPHPNESLLVCPAGSAAVINGQLWHGGTVNRSGARRRVLHVAYIGREIPQFQMSQREYLRKATWDRITPAARYILDVL